MRVCDNHGEGENVSVVLNGRGRDPWWPVMMSRLDEFGWRRKGY